MSSIADHVRYTVLDGGNAIRLRGDGYLGCIEFRGPDVISIDAAELEAYEDSLADLLHGRDNQWGYQITVQRGTDVAHPSTGAWPSPMVYAFDTARRLRYEREGEHRPTTHRLWVSYYPDTTQRKLIATLSGDADLSDPAPRRTFDEQLDALTRQLAMRAYDVRRLGLVQHTLGSENFVSSALLDQLAEEYTWESQSYAIDPDEPMFVSPIVLPDRVLPVPLVIDDHPHVVASLYGYPPLLESATLAAVARLPYRTRFSSRIIPLSPMQARASLTKRSRGWLLSSLDLSLILPRSRSSTEGNENALSVRDGLQAELSRVDDGTAYAIVTHTIVIRADSQAQVPAIEDQLKQLAERLKVRLVIERGPQAYNAWLASMPGELDRNVARRATVSMRAAMRTAPITSTWNGPKVHPNKRYPSPEPVLMLTTPAKEPFRFWHHFGEVGHTMIFGRTGHGKSVLLRAIENGHLSRYKDSFVVVADIGYSALAYAKVIGAPHVIADRNAGPQFAVLKGIHDPPQRNDILEWTVDLYETWTNTPATPPLVRSIKTGLKSLAESDPSLIRLSMLATQVPDEELRAFFANFRDSFLDAVDDHLDFEHTAIRYWAIEYGTLGIDNVRWVAPFIAYIQRLVYASFEKQKTAPRLIVIDEAARGLRSRRVADFAERLEREGRKHLASAILATQTPTEIVNSPLGSAIIQQTATLISFGEPRITDPEIQRTYRTVGFSAEQCSLIRSLGDYEFLIANQQGTQICQLLPTPLELAVYAGASDDTTQLIQRLIATHGDHDFIWPFLQERARTIPGLHDYIDGLKSLNPPALRSEALTYA
ncbi:MAG: VirB4 family type IV secretion system protein [Vulcanimicrobiaceae bacterium]